jgi:DNA-binding winged helix-turn-helix (wHTH) protein
VLFRSVDVHVGRLRKALNRGHGTDPIRTVRGAGYSLDDRFGKDERVVKDDRLIKDDRLGKAS